MLTTSGYFTTANASRYLQQLCKHFGHKIEVSFDAHAGRIEFPMGPVTLTADAEKLTAHAEAADAEGIANVQSVIDRHLERFAFREEFKGMTWDTAAE